MAQEVISDEGSHVAPGMDLKEIARASETLLHCIEATSYAFEDSHHMIVLPGGSRIVFHGSSIGIESGIVGGEWGEGCTEETVDLCIFHLGDEAYLSPGLSAQGFASIPEHLYEELQWVVRTRGDIFQLERYVGADADRILWEIMWEMSYVKECSLHCQDQLLTYEFALNNHTYLMRTALREGAPILFEIIGWDVFRDKWQENGFPFGSQVGNPLPMSLLIRILYQWRDKLQGVSTAQELRCKMDDFLDAMIGQYLRSDRSFEEIYYAVDRCSVLSGADNVPIPLSGGRDMVVASKYAYNDVIFMVDEMMEILQIHVYMQDGSALDLETCRVLDIPYIEGRKMCILVDPMLYSLKGEGFSGGVTFPLSENARDWLVNQLPVFD